MIIVSSQDEPIAIVGLACRTAGAADVDDLWAMLCDKRRMIGPVPDGRVPAVDSGLMKIQQMHAALVDDIAGFDAAFFGISRRMAAWMDPHQRMFLELTWHALESAALAPERLDGLPVGVFAAAPMAADYRERMIAAGVSNSGALTGTMTAFAANRISYHFNWTGPSYALDSACSSGLSALSPAVQGLRNGEFPLAAVMGANINCYGFATSAGYQAGALSPSGRSVPFSPLRDGYIRGEGGACLILKRLDDAVRDGTPVHALIRGVGVAHNGRAGGLTGGDVNAQTQLMLSTARAAGVPVGSIGYVEAHGTGTTADTVEVEAVKQTVRPRAGDPQASPTGPDNKVWIGSIKSSIGHLEPAAGLLGVVKAVLILRHDLIPATAGLDSIDPAFNLDEIPVALADRPIHWPAGRAARRIGVNAFGMGGSMAHAIVEEPVGPSLPPARISLPSSVVAVPLSAADAAALSDLAGKCLQMLDAPHPPDLAGLAWTLQTGRDALRERCVLTVGSLDHLRSALKALTGGVPGEYVAKLNDKEALRHLPPGLAQDAADWLDGKPIDWAAHWPAPRPAHSPRLPGYPFQRSPHWFDSNVPAK